MRYKTRKVFISLEGHPMKLLLLCPKGSNLFAGRPGILWIHGGGYITGMPEMVYMSRAKNLVKNMVRLSFVRIIVWPE